MSASTRESSDRESHTPLVTQLSSLEIGSRTAVSLKSGESAVAARMRVWRAARAAGLVVRVRRRGSGELNVEVLGTRAVRHSVFLDLVQGVPRGVWPVLGALAVLVIAGWDLNWMETQVGHHWFYNNFRISGLFIALSEGRSGRWIYPFSYGWGSPLFVYTAPLPFYSGAIIRLLGVPTVVALNAVWHAAFFGGGIAMLWVTTRIFGKWSGLLASAAYTLAPYHLVDVYVRANLGETVAYAFAPWVLFGLWLASKRNRWGVVITSVAVAAIALSHVPSIITLGIGFGVFVVLCLVLLDAGEGRSMLGSSAIAAILGPSLTAFFVLPAIMDLDLVRGAYSLVAGHSDYRNHFLGVRDLSGIRWAFDMGVPTIDSGLTLTVGPGLVFLALISTALAFAVRQRRVTVERHRGDDAGRGLADRRAALVIAAIGSALVTTWITTSSSAWLWESIPIIQKIQFPWRFHLSTSFFLAVAAGGAPGLVELAITRPNRKRTACALAVAGTIVMVLLQGSHARAAGHSGIPAEDDRAEVIIRKGVTTSNDEFVPAHSDVPGQGDFPNRAFEVIGDRELPTVTGSQLENGWAIATLQEGEAAILVLNQHWYPAWHATVDGVDVPTRRLEDHRFAPVAVDIPAGAREVEFRFTTTGWGTAGRALSVLALVALAALVFQARRDHRVAFDRVQTTDPPRSV